MDVQFSCSGVNVPLGWQCEGKEPLLEGPLKLMHIILDVAIHWDDLHELIQIYFVEPLNIHWPTFAVNAMVALTIVL